MSKLALKKSLREELSELTVVWFDLMSHYSCEAHHWPQTEPSLRCRRAGKNRSMPCKLRAWRPISPSEHKVQVVRLLIASSNAEPAAFGQRCTVSNTQCCWFRQGLF